MDSKTSIGTELPTDNHQPGLRCALGVIIVNYKTPGLVIDCLGTLDGQLEPGERVIIVDNDSRDDSVTQITEAIEGRGWLGWARIVEAGGNRGFSAGNNIGIEALEADTYLLLNSDTLVGPNAIASLRGALLANPQIAIFGPRLEGLDGQVQVSTFRSPSPLSEFERAAATGPITTVLRRWTVALAPPEVPTLAEWMSFAAILIRREVFEEVGLMDEGYFMYFEDVDFCCRAGLAGYKCLHWPDAQIVHLHGRSSSVKENQARRRRLPTYYYASRSRLLAKSYGRVGLLLANALWICGRCVSLVREWIHHKDPHLCESEARDLWCNFLHPVNPPATHVRRLQLQAVERSVSE